MAIARTLITEPRMLVLDEPTEGIQPNVVAEIERIIVDLASRGDLSVLLVEQHVGFSLRASDVYYVMESGRISHSGASDATAAHEVSAALAICLRARAPTPPPASGPPPAHTASDLRCPAQPVQGTPGQRGRTGHAAGARPTPNCRHR